MTRQRRLSIPSSSGGDGVDPNLVASYLDNELDPDAVAEYEKKCLSHDVVLAEVASVHQILSLLGHKVKVPAAARARMYQLVKGRETTADAAGGEGSRRFARACHEADQSVGCAGSTEAVDARAVRSGDCVSGSDRALRCGGVDELDDATAGGFPGASGGGDRSGGPGRLGAGG